MRNVLVAIMAAVRDSVRVIFTAVRRGGKVVLEASTEIVKGATQVAVGLVQAPFQLLGALKPKPPAGPVASDAARAKASEKRAEAGGEETGADLLHALAMRQAARALLRGEKPAVLGRGLDELLAGLDRETLRLVATSAPSGVLALLSARPPAKSGEEMLASLRADISAGQVPTDRPRFRPMAVPAAVHATAEPPRSHNDIMSALLARRAARKPS